MAVQRGRWPVLLLALATLAVSLVACQAPSGSGNSPTGDGAGIVISTPAGQAASPTPTFPPFTIGAWPSNFSPNNNDTVTIYVIVRVQDPTMNGPSSPPPQPVTVTVSVLAPIGQQKTATTGADGIAAVPITFNDPQSGTPVTVEVTATWKGVTYHNRTFFTPSPKAKPSPTPSGGGGTPGPDVTPTDTPTS